MVEFECGESLKSKIKFLMILSLLFWYTLQRTSKEKSKQKDASEFLKKMDLNYSISRWYTW